MIGGAEVEKTSGCSSEESRLHSGGCRVIDAVANATVPLPGNCHAAMHDETRPCVAWENRDAINVA